MAPWQLGIKAVFAKSYARIHKANLINVGIVPFVCDTTGIDKGDELEIDVTNLSGPLTLRNKTKGTTIPVKAELSERDVRMVRAGGLLALGLADQKR